jgi:hypothetical protein
VRSFGCALGRQCLLGAATWKRTEAAIAVQQEEIVDLGSVDLTRNTPCTNMRLPTEVESLPNRVLSSRKEMGEHLHHAAAVAT